MIRKVVLLGHIDGWGGSQTAFKELILFCIREGHNVKIIPITDLPKSEVKYESNILIGTIAHKAQGIGATIQKTKNLLEAALKVRLFAPEIFVSVGLGNSANFISAFLPKKCFKIGQDFIANREVNDEVWHKARSSFDGIALQSPSMLNFWQQQASIKGINWLPCFPQPPVQGIFRKNEEGNEIKEIRIGYFGRLAGNKGLHLLLNALACVAAESKVTLDLWGKGEEEKNLQQLAMNLQLNNFVSFLGPFPSGEEGAKLMVTYHALALTSTGIEGLPLILLESMAYGIPFLTTNVGAIKDCCVANSDCVLAEPNQESVTAGLAELIRRITDNSFDSSRLRAYYNDNFSHQTMDNRWRECFNNPNTFFYG